ncbi:ABC transporter permease [Hypericibacter terrae]|jgi:spermidine/putrescine transport system permease protein|uniref:ABC transporter permease n=2 Tax=Hypericibacter TaxID=2705399 RepID=A0A5J6MMX0_9PROT|nr:ABC transporter permease [Hypericibacter terrae]QEX18713.1 ABC transporter permease [Hypericibacter terrae]
MATEVERSWRDPALIGKALPTVLLQTSCFLAPLLMTFLLTFQKTKNFQLTWAWNLDVWTDVFTKPHYWTILIHTLVMAVTCTALCVVLSLPIAYALATRMKRFENHIKILITFAFLTDATLKTFGWVLFLDAHGAANYLLEQIGFAPGTIAILFTDWATMLGMVYSLLAFTIFTIYLSIDQIDRSLILAAYDAGAGKFRAFWEVTLPLCRPGIWAGVVLVFLLAVGVFLEPKVLGGGKSPMSAELIRQTFETRVNWPLGAALTFVLMAAAVFFILLFNRVYSLKRSMVA